MALTEAWTDAARVAADQSRRLHYHVSERRFRGDIQKQGLRGPTPDWQQVHLWDSLPAAQAYARRLPADVWEVDTTGLPLTRPGHSAAYPSTVGGTHFEHDGPIAPARLRRVAERSTKGDWRITEADATSQQDSQSDPKIAAAGAALALVGAPSPIAPVYIGTGSAAAVVKGAVAATAATMAGVTDLISSAVSEVLRTRYPGVTPNLSEVDQRAAAFPIESAARVRAGMKAALLKPSRKMLLEELDKRLSAAQSVSVPDQPAIEKLARARTRVAATVGPREHAVATVVNNERRFAAQHAAAQVARTVGLAEQARLEQTSPDGAMWVLGEHVKNHTIDCTALSGGVYPHSVLRKLHPPIHTGCCCRLVGIPDAINQGILDPADIPSAPVAIKRAQRALAVTEHDARGLLMLEELKSRGPLLIEATSRDTSVFEDDWSPASPEKLSRRISRLQDGDVVRLPDGTTIRSKASGVQVRRDGAVKRGLTPEMAAMDALDRSARSGKPGSIGDRAYRDFRDFLGEVYTEVVMPEKESPRIVPPLKEPELFTWEDTGHSDQFYLDLGWSAAELKELREKRAASA